MPEAFESVDPDLSFGRQDVRLVRSHAGQEVGDECAGHDDGLLLIGDNGGEIAGGLRRNCWERRRGAMVEGVLRRDHVHGLVAVVEAVERGVLERVLALARAGDGMAAAPASGCGRGCGGDLEWWRILGRDEVVFPEVVAVADTPLDPAMAELVWVDGGAGRPRALPVDGMFCRRFGERLGPLAAADHGGPLIARLGSVIRLRRGARGRRPNSRGPWSRASGTSTLTCAG